MLDKAVTLEIRAEMHRQLLNSQAFPAWTLCFRPPANLLATNEQVDTVMKFRIEQAETTMRFYISILEEEAKTAHIEADNHKKVLCSIYSEQEGKKYSVDEALQALLNLTQRARTTQIQIHQKQFNIISESAKLALWQDIPPHFIT